MGAKPAAWSLVALTPVTAIVSAALQRAHDPNYPTAGEVGVFFAAMAFGLVFGVTGALIASRAPRNPIGWLFLAVAGLTGATGLAESVRNVALSANPESLLGRVAASFANSSWVLLVLLPGTLVALLFPEGRLPGRSWRWRVVGWAAVIAVVTMYLDLLLGPGPLDDAPEIVNPLGQPWVPLLAWVVVPALLISLGGGVTAAVVRMRRGTGVVRQQMRWFVFAAAALVASLVIASVAGGLGVPGEDFFNGVVLLAVGLFPVATAVAILRYRLYDIDRLISRTVSYAVLTGLLAVPYLVIVSIVSRIVAGSSAGVAAATLAVAALFNPLRRRVQATVDRRFNRSRYDAARTVEAFTARLREQVDLDSLRAELVAIVHQTMQPATVSLWLRPAASSAPIARP